MTMIIRAALVVLAVIGGVSTAAAYHCPHRDYYYEQRSSADQEYPEEDARAYFDRQIRDGR